MMGGARQSPTTYQMLALLALATPAVAYYDGPRGYCSPFTARYLEFIDGRFVGYAPVVEAGAEEGADGEAYIGLSTSADGVRWTAWTRVLKSERDVDLGAKKFRYRSLDQPVCGLLRHDGRTTLYVQREVAGIYSPSQDCCNKPITRLEAIDVSRWVA